MRRSQPPWRRPHEAARGLGGGCGAQYVYEAIPRIDGDVGHRQRGLLIVAEFAARFLVDGVRDAAAVIGDHALGTSVTPATALPQSLLGGNRRQLDTGVGLQLVQQR